MSSSTVSIAFLAALLFVSSTMGHSQMRCAKYNTKTGECYAQIRNQGQSFLEEAYDLVTGQKGICQSSWTNPITASYANGAMGTYTPGEVFSVQWVARNHAIENQTPGNITLYLSPAESVNQGADVTADVMKNNKFCTAPFISCNGQNGDLVSCSAECTMPKNTQAGLYTIWWKWVWPGHTQIFSTCADIYVVASGSNAPSSPAPTPATPTAPSTTGSKASAVPSTTGRVQASATGAQAAKPSTTGSAAAAPTPTPTPASSGSCSAGNMKCLSSETYSTCTSAGSWGNSQSCSVGMTCSPAGSYIYCVNPTKPISTTPSSPAAPTPVAPTPVPVPSTPSTPSTPASSPSSDSCVMGYQRCSGASSYQVCGNGRNGPSWSVDLPCVSGLSCHASSNNIYCY